MKIAWVLLEKIKPKGETKPDHFLFICFVSTVIFSLIPFFNISKIHVF